MPASIQSTLLDSPGGIQVPGTPILVGLSRDDLRKGYQVELESVDVGASYDWELEFIPSTPDGTLSAAVLLTPTAKVAHFSVDHEGPYLVRLTIDLGLPTEGVQYVRMRFATRFGGLPLVAAGERRDADGIFPVDIDTFGWTPEQNQNVQRLLAVARRRATSG